jgi:hypothetical protein
MAVSLGSWEEVAAEGFRLQARMDELGLALRDQAAQLAAGEYRWLVALEEFDRGGGWALQGAKRCTEWLGWACGLSPGAARERLRVARALPGLPRVSEAFGQGRLSFSKVRAITRVATPENEETLVVYGLEATAWQLEKVVRLHAQLVEAGQAQTRFERRRLRWRDDDQGTAFSLWLPADLAAACKAMIERFADRLWQEWHAAGDAVAGDARSPEQPVVSDRDEAPPPREVLRADALLTMLETATATEPTPVQGPDRQLVVVHVRAEAAADDLAADERLVGSEIGPVGATGPLTVREARAAVSGRAVPGASPPAGRVTAHLDDGTPLGSATARMLACDAAVVRLVEDADGVPIGVTSMQHAVSAGQRRAVRNRDGGCRWPGCPEQRFVEVHHVWHQANGGPSALWNLVLLCRFHHRVVHHTPFFAIAYGDQTFSFHRPDGVAVRSGLALPGADGGGIAVANRAHGVTPNQDSLIPDWDGKHPDYDMAVAVLQAATYGPGGPPWSQPTGEIGTT